MVFDYMSVFGQGPTGVTGPTGPAEGGTGDASDLTRIAGESPAGF